MASYKQPCAAPDKFKDELVATVKAICTPGKGILAADESTGTIGKRFDDIGVENNLENRRAYRELLVESAPQMKSAISGVIFYEESLTQKTSSGKLFVDILRENGIVSGIKTDLGVKPLGPDTPETATQGLDNLDQRSATYYSQGARFAKWRQVIICDPAHGLPSELALTNMAETLARYAAISQMNGLVPIVEPEMLAENKFSIAEGAYHTERVLSALFKRLQDHHVFLEGCILKVHMVTSAFDSGVIDEPAAVAAWTLRTFRRTIPPALGGIVFLSGGQADEQATVNLSAVNAAGGGRLPWFITFSYGRALQKAALSAWRGKAENVGVARDALLQVANSLNQAQLGTYVGSGKPFTADLFEKNYVY
jgi:fructose-bisphosphate aldolase class I